MNEETIKLMMRWIMHELDQVGNVRSVHRGTGNLMRPGDVETRVRYSVHRVGM